jgi:phosphate transport system substrate-binding protein
MKKPFHSVPLVLALAGAAGLAGILEAQSVQVRATVSEALPHYKPEVQIKGALEIPCTDALSDLGDEWNRGYRKFQPQASLVFLAKLSGEAATALVSGKAPLVILARELTAGEMKAFQDKYGYLPMRIPVCMDATIVFVNKANPITSITMQQLDAIYSKTRLGGAAAPALVWGDLGVQGELAKRAINAYARAEGTATRAAFATTALLKGEYRAGIIDREDSSALAEAVSTDAAGIGFGPMASWFATNKTLPVVPYGGTEARYPTQEMVTTSRYPMPRLFYAYLNRAPGQPVAAPVNEALHYVLAQEGQNEVADVGLLPGPVEFMSIAIKRLSR